MQILINRNGQQLGPYTPEQVNEYLAAGSLSPNDPAWHEGLAEWVPLNQVGGIVVPAASTPPPFDPGAIGASASPPVAPSPPPAAGPPMAPQMAMGTALPSGSPREMGWFDKTFSQTSIVVLVLFGLCCGGIALIFGIIGIATCKDPTAKRNAIIVLVLGAIMTALGVFMQFARAAAM